MKQSASEHWKSFQQSGKIEDYLSYRKAREQYLSSVARDASGMAGSEAPDANDTGGDRPSSIQG